MLIITRCAVIDHIEGILDSDEVGTYRLVFQDGSIANVQSGHDIRQLTAYFGCTHREGIQEKIQGQRIVYCMTERRRLRGFTPVDEWEGPELNEGDFLVDRDCCCGGPG